VRVALVHDSLTQLGGAERVLRDLHEVYPDAPVFVLVHDPKILKEFEDWTIVSSPLQYIFKYIPKFQWMLFLIPWAVRIFDFSEFDVVISSSSTFVKAIKVPKHVVHIDYCHTPPRFLWSESESYVKQEVPVLIRPFIKLFLSWMKKWDYKAAQRVDYILTNSKNVQGRVKKYYNRESIVLYPAIDTEFFHPEGDKHGYYLIAGRLQAHKNIDLVIEAFNRLGLQLHVVGTGRAQKDLEKAAKDNIHFFGRVEDEILRKEYSGALAFIYPQDEDFGLMPLEANACGTPVIAYRKGGSLETVIEGKTGAFFDQQSVESIVEVLEKFKPEHYFSEDLFDNAEKYAKGRFAHELQEFVEKVVEENSHANRD
jgi:glycosyltransferase involved in cell wall biosynthesis